MLSIELERTTQAQSNWRSRMSELLDELEAVDSGLLITVDEIDPTLDELTLLASIYQIFLGEGRRIALIMVGLPEQFQNYSQASTSPSCDGLSYIDSAQYLTMRCGRLWPKPCKMLEEPSLDEALNLAVEAIGGFAYLIQLVGYRAWDINPTTQEITLSDMRLGITSAHAEMEEHVIAASYRELSDGDIAFLEAMAVDHGDSAIKDITVRLGWSTSQVAQSRKRLIDAGLIGARRRGIVGFELSYLRQYVVKHSES